MLNKPKITTAQSVEVLTNAIGALKITFNEHQALRAHLNVLIEKAVAHDNAKEQKPVENKEEKPDQG